ncbi:class II fructose-bisphosphate aldolase family protein [Mycolicibacterium sp. 018/SC-01/001]|uniref:class II fructose-bisphosphate aldolase n=1 Tax=Mycolicibacterium sp. 018/SC-01/001 TaxID=2592069 RepID=UPI00117CB67D|nr:class II fructose-bisphosphate aldolase [Mycolicibacterium sp. 018/SC-01/001]TRW80430.1 class II fructose-bisphosphate aldolase family protein [Mycolicibacterium sp. 018/SC-01/001]
MTLASTSDLLAAAIENRSAVMAFNVITLEHAEGIAAGVERAGAAALIQISENTVRFHGDRLAPITAACAQIAAASTAPLALHLDHIQDPELLDEAIATATQLGVTSVMIDAAHHDADENIRKTASLAERAHAAGLFVEAELGQVGGKDGRVLGAHEPGARTDPDDAAAFAAQTGVDALAVAVGSSHAMTTRDADLDMALIREIAAAVPIPLVLHGSSGVADENLRAAVAAGIRKVNVGTALNVAYTGAVRTVLESDVALTDPRKYLLPAREAVAETVASLCRVIAASEVQAS